MVTKCANPACVARFRYLSKGRLFRLEVEYDKDEYFWLCSDCASKMVLKVEKGRGVITVPLPIATPPEVPLASEEHDKMAGDLRPQPTTDVFLAVNCSNHGCRGRIFLMRARQRYSSDKPKLPPSFRIVCPKCGERQMVRRAATYLIDVDSTAVTLTDIL
jgi:hypothetical protein